MTDDDPDVDEDVQDDADEQPEIDDDEMADISAVAEEIEEETSHDVQEESDDVQDDQDDASLDAPTEAAGRGVTPGDIYCNGLGMLAAVARTQHGSADADDRSELVEEYGDIARDLQIDQYVDELLEERGGMDELSPGQALMATTMMWGGMVAMDDPEMVDGIGEALNA